MTETRQHTNNKKNKQCKQRQKPYTKRFKQTFKKNRQKPDKTRQTRYKHGFCL